MKDHLSTGVVYSMNQKKWYDAVSYDGIRATDEQIASLNRLCTRYGQTPTDIWLEVNYRERKPDTLFCRFPFILIGIEPDGYAHS